MQGKAQMTDPRYDGSRMLAQGTRKEIDSREKFPMKKN
jgi:hypothetical protein